METLSKSEIEAELASRLPSYKVECTLHSDGTLSALLSGPNADHFAVTGIVRADYKGRESLSRLAREILEEMVLSRQGSRTSRLQALTDKPGQSPL
ncbi:hypothetical protein CCU68_21930 [Pseudomonas gingeri NCPPB 3146 = LMG 5327]|uniref:DUF1652 domain-containing protein n=2 Tax=Pseudomonas gingeri TaxID=117681 RepID=A0A7Y8CEW7_9PSED|nr:hypothetical protein [Pseudomonas gingeri]NVZ26667.1 hypothetical protein [Pseudomonas gingeri]NVZ60478.1 hypothetical protein [Pseudomonas gingeri]NVZ74239.1 hypothetical protein [Pseudomonas gingeri]NWA09680.1 hypothetical protein [Pseudomonas gingeri]NWC16228.1 hypothetical protein [Pseudomonas gingeri]